MLRTRNNRLAGKIDEAIRTAPLPTGMTWNDPSAASAPAGLFAARAAKAGSCDAGTDRDPHKAEDHRGRAEGSDLRAPTP